MGNIINKFIENTKPPTWPVYSWDKHWNEIKFDLIREEEWQSPATLQGVEMTDQNAIDQLEKRLDRIEARSGLMSKSWFNRVFTTWVYFLIAQVMIGLVVLFLGMIFGLLG